MFFKCLVVLLVMCCALMRTALAAPPTESELQSGGAKRLTSDEIRALHADRTVYHTNVVAGKGTPMWYGADGMRAFRAGQRLFQGEWVARDDARCEETIAGPVVCMTVYQRGNEWAVCDPREAPECRWRIEKTVPGDVERLGKRP